MLGRRVLVLVLVLVEYYVVLLQDMLGRPQSCVESPNRRGRESLKGSAARSWLQLGGRHFGEWGGGRQQVGSRAVFGSQHLFRHKLR